MTDSVEKELSRALSASVGSAAAELGELFADKIRYMRWTSAVRTLDRARDFARQRGGMGQVPPLKFFLPYMENCSLEDDDDEVIDFWANLLVSASQRFGSGHLLFMRILREITGDEARLLRRIALVGRQGPVALSALEDALSNWEMFSAPASPFNTLETPFAWDRAKIVLFSEIVMPGIAVEHFALGMKGGDGNRRQEIESLDMVDTPLHTSDYISLDILVSLNVITKVLHEYERDNQHLEGAAYCLTAMGAKFFAECSAGDVIPRQPDD